MQPTTTLLSSQPSSQPLALRYAVGVLLVMLVSVGVFWIIMQPPMQEVGLMALFLSATSLVSIVLGYAVYRIGWLHRSFTLRWTLLGGYALASILTFVNVWVTARLMFTSRHDLLLATVLLIFAGGIAMVLGVFLSSALADRIRQIDRAAHDISQGDLDVRVPVEGRDEMADLAAAFNEMAAQLQAAERKQRDLDTIRRDLIAWVSHDLQTPLASMRLLVEALQDGLVTSPEARDRYLRTVQKDIRHLSALIDDLFQMAQLDAGGLVLDRELGSLADLISDTLESFSEQANRLGVSLTGSVEPDVDPVWMDTQRIGRVVNNLIANALGHSNAGGRVVVSAIRTERGVQVTVSDTGEGISSEDLPYVFDRFYRAEKSRSPQTGRAGLGLAIARGIIGAHGGSITADSRLGEGTSISFTLPGSERSV